MFGYGEVPVAPENGGYPVPFARRDLRMPIHRTPQNVVPEYRPGYASWGKIGITPNGQIVSLGDSADDAVAALDKAGPRGAAALGAAAGFVFSDNRLVGALLGGVLGYFGGAYVTNVAKKALAVVRTATPTVASVVTPKAAP
jgi:hypothetical protein